MLVRSARELDAAQLAHRAARSIAPGDPGGGHLPGRAVHLLERRGDMAGLLLQRDQLGIPLNRDAPIAKLVAHDPFVVVLTEDENERIGRDALPALIQGHTRHPPAFRPQIRARAVLPELQRPVHDAEPGVDLHGARLHADGPRLKRRPGVAVDDHRAHASATELIGEHQPRGARSDDQDVSIQWNPPTADSASRLRRCCRAHA